MIIWIIYIYITYLFLQLIFQKQLIENIKYSATFASLLFTRKTHQQQQKENWQTIFIKISEFIYLMV